jgi:hypothetical protein
MQVELQLSMVLAAVLAAGVSAAYWRQAVLAAMVLLVFEGALRKWALPEAQAALYLAKDVILLGAYVGFGMARGYAAPVAPARPFIMLLAMSATYGAIEMLNPALPSLTLAAVGWRSYFFYVPLLFVVPQLFDTLDDLDRALRRYALIALPVAALGIVQFYSPIDSELNTLVQHDPSDRATSMAFGQYFNRARVAGTFAYVSGFGAYLMAVAFLILALQAGRAWRFRGNVLLHAGLLVIVAALFATGSRAPVYMLVVAVAAYSLLTALAGDLSAGAAFRTCVGALILAAGIWTFLPEPAGAFQNRAFSADDTYSRIVAPLVEPFDILEEAGPAGFGIGAAHQSAAYLVDSGYPWWTKGIVAESETSRVMLELGIPGFTLVFLFRIAIALFALRAAFLLRSRRARSIALVLALFLGFQVIGSVIFNPTMNVLYWFAVGMLFALHRYEARDAQRVRVRRLIGGRRDPVGARRVRARGA